MFWPRTKYDLETQQREGYVFAYVRTPALTPEVSEEIVADIRDAVAEIRAVRLMFEYETAHVLNEEETLQFTNTLVSRMPGTKVALISRDSKHRPSLSMVEGIARERGMDFKAFANTDGVESWLMDD
jgi:hypothetical protein